MTIRKSGISRSRSTPNRGGKQGRRSRSNLRQDTPKWFGQSIEPETFDELGVYFRGKIYEVEGGYTSNIHDVINGGGDSKLFDITTVRSLLEMDNFFYELEDMADDRGVMIMEDHNRGQLIYVPVRYDDDNMRSIDQMGEHMMSEKGYDSYFLVNKDSIQRTGTIRKEEYYKKDEPPL